MSEKEQTKEARLDTLEALKPSGVYSIRPARIDDHHLLWKAGWTIPTASLENWQASPLSKNWVIYDTGNDLVVFTSQKSRVKEVYDIYQYLVETNQFTGDIYLYDPRKTNSDPEPERTLPYQTKRYAHKKGRGKIK